MEKTPTKKGNRETGAGPIPKRMGRACKSADGQSEPNRKRLAGRGAGSIWRIQIGADRTHLLFPDITDDGPKYSVLVFRQSPRDSYS
jgi:hypothetical protein